MAPTLGFDNRYPDAQRLGKQNLDYIAQNPNDPYLLNSPSLQTAQAKRAGAEARNAQEMAAWQQTPAGQQFRQMRANFANPGLSWQDRMSQMRAYYGGLPRPAGQTDTIDPNASFASRYVDTGRAAPPGQAGNYDPMGRGQTGFGVGTPPPYYGATPGSLATEAPRPGSSAPGSLATNTRAVTAPDFQPPPPSGTAVYQPSTTGGGGTVDARTAYAVGHPNWNGVGTPWLTDPTFVTGGGITPPPSTTATGGLGSVDQTAASMGITTTPAAIAPPVMGPAPTVAAPPTINAPVAQAAQGGFNNFDEMQQAAFQKAYTPVERELTRQQGLADQQLNAQLAQTGLAASGTGINARERQANEFEVRKQQAATDAANQATVTRYGLQYQQSIDNAHLRQEANLANAGFSMQAQSQNAQNILTAGITNANLQNSRDLANAQNYLAAMGLNIQQASSARSSFLQYLGLQETDLARMDAYNLEVVTLLFNTYLKQYGATIDAGKVQSGKTDQSSDSTNIGLSGGLM